MAHQSLRNLETALLAGPFYPALMHSHTRKDGKADFKELQPDEFRVELKCHRLKQ